MLNAIIPTLFAMLLLGGSLVVSASLIRARSAWLEMRDEWNALEQQSVAPRNATVTPLPNRRKVSGPVGVFVDPSVRLAAA